MFGLLNKTIPALTAAALIGLFVALCAASTDDPDDNIVDVPMPFEHDGHPIWQDAVSALMRLKELPDASQNIAVLRANEPALFNNISANSWESAFKMRSKLAIEFLRREFNEEYARLDVSSPTAPIAPEAQIRALWQDIDYDAKTLQKLTELKITDVKLMQLIWDDLREDFLALGTFPFADRLKALGITADQYARAFGEAAKCLDDYIKLHREIENNAVQRQELAYQAMPQNGMIVQMSGRSSNGTIKIMSNVNISIGGVPMPKARLIDSIELLAFENTVGYPQCYAAEPCKGIKIMRCGDKEWRNLVPGDYISITDVLMAAGPEAARLTLKDTRCADLRPGHVLTLWEIDFQIPPQTAELIVSLVDRFGSQRYTERQAAADRLYRIGRIALPYLRAAVDDPDPEIAARAADIIYRLLEIKPREALIAIRDKAGE